MQRLGLCCIFREVPIRFRRTTATYFPGVEGVSRLVLENVRALVLAIDWCLAHQITSFRINSHLFPVATHPECGYKLEDLPDQTEIAAVMDQVRSRSIRLTFHPDQYVVLNSPREDVVEKSIEELEHHGWMAERLGADVINIHGGGGYGDKEGALLRFEKNLGRLSDRVRSRLTVENDDRTYTPQDLLCLPLPLVYDVHHHRCLPDRLSIEEATDQALATWDREPLFHVSSARLGGDPRRHADLIDPVDVPTYWDRIDPLTVEVEAKAKEVAVMELQCALVERGWRFS